MGYNLASIRIMSKEPIALADAITALRAELTRSIASSTDEELRFEVGQITVEFQMEVERSTSASAGVKFWVLQAGGIAAGRQREIHKLVVPLTPRLSRGGPVLTGRDS